jgi:curved DNA-binding protein CbpA
MSDAQYRQSKAKIQDWALGKIPLTDDLGHLDDRAKPMPASNFFNPNGTLAKAGSEYQEHLFKERKQATNLYSEIGNRGRLDSVLQEIGDWKKLKNQAQSSPSYQKQRDESHQKVERDWWGNKKIQSSASTDPRHFSPEAFKRMNAERDAAYNRGDWDHAREVNRQMQIEYNKEEAVWGDRDATKKEIGTAHWNEFKSAAGDVLLGAMKAVWDAFRKGYATAYEDAKRAHDANNNRGSNSYRPSEPVERRRSPYDVLGVRENAPWSEVRSAYREAMMNLHPDRVSQTGMDQRRRRPGRRKLMQLTSSWKIRAQCPNRSGRVSPFRRQRNVTLLATARGRHKRTTGPKVYRADHLDHEILGQWNHSLAAVAEEPFLTTRLAKRPLLFEFVWLLGVCITTPTSPVQN